MKPFSSFMYPDDITILRSVPVTDDEGDSKRSFPSDPEPSKAAVMSKSVDRMLKDGRTVTIVVHVIATPTNVNLKADDKVEWIGRTLTVEVGTYPKGIGNVTWRTHCLESK